MMRVIHYTSANGSILLTIIIRIIYDMNIMYNVVSEVNK